MKVRGAWADHGDWTIPFSHPHHWKFSCVGSGCMDVISTTDHWQLGAGEAVIFAPGDRCRVQAQAGSTCGHVLFSPLLATGWMTPWSFLDLPARGDFSGWDTIAAMAETYDEDHWRHVDGGMKARLQFDGVLYRFVCDGFATGAMRTRPQRPSWLQDAITAAAQACRQAGFDVAAFARLAGCSPEHLCRTLKDSDGISPQAFLRNLRIQQASHMLQHDPATPMADLVERCGYSSEQQLRRQFKQVTGMTIRDARTGAEHQSPGRAGAK